LDQTPCPIGAYCVGGVSRRGGITPSFPLPFHPTITSADMDSSHQVIFDCPPGSYGNAPRQSSPACSGLCQPGFFCPVGSTSNTQVPTRRPENCFRCINRSHSLILILLEGGRCSSELISPYSVTCNCRTTLSPLLIAFDTVPLALTLIVAVTVTSCVFDVRRILVPRVRTAVHMDSRLRTALVLVNTLSPVLLGKHLPPSTRILIC